SVTGKVISSQDNTPLIGVNVMLSGESTGTITDLDGNYSLSNVPSDGALVFSYVGYETQTVNVSNRSVVDVTLSVGNVLNEIVVTSFGIPKDKKYWVVALKRSQEMIYGSPINKTLSMAC
ncbi:MAG: carboxypeptidase-like regulatory domain-containing protein, partial [Saprospiraceae bacterium]|nr:carboxypeptidase-like regulatory domain-containing protein [Saprospiraceae bacterium]